MAKNRIEKYDIVAKEAIDTIEKLSKELIRLTDELHTAKDSAKLLNKEFGNIKQNNSGEELRKLTEATKAYHEANKKIIDTQKEIETLERERIENLKLLAESRKAAADAEAAELKLLKQKENAQKKDKQLTREQMLANEEARQAKAQLNREIKEEIQNSKVAKDSLAALSSQLAKMKKEYREASAEVREKMLPAIQELDAQVKELDYAIGNHQRNVGNYAGAIREAANSGGLLGAEFENVVGFGSSIVNIFRAIAEGITKGSAAAKIFKVALMSTGVGALVVAVGSLVAYFTKVSDGSEKIRIAFAQMDAIIDTLIARVGKLGKGLYQFFSGDFKDAGETLSNVFTGLGQEIDQAATNAANATKELIALERTTVKYTTALAYLNQQIEINNTIADDATRSFKEREEASEKARIAAEEAAKMQIQLAQIELSIIQQNNAVAKARGELMPAVAQAEADAVAKVIDAQTALQKVLLDNEKQRRELIQDRLEKDLDILIDGYDNQKTINERIINDENNLFEYRKNKLAETIALGQTTFNEQIATIQQFTTQAINANDLINESDANVLNAKIRALGLSEIIEGRLLEVIRERKTAIYDLNELEMQLLYEEVQRKQAANDALLELQQQRTIAQITDAQQKRDKLIEIENELLQKQLSNANLFEEEKKLLIEQSNDRIAQINSDFAKTQEQQKTEANEGLKQVYAQTYATANEFVDLLQEAANKEIEINNSLIQSSKDKVSQLESDLQEQIKLKNEGIANNSAAIQAEIELEKQRQQTLQQQREEAIKKQKAAATAKIAIDTAQQASSLATAIAGIYESLAPVAPPLGQILATVLSAGMVASFAASKAKALQTISVPEFYEGGEYSYGGGYTGDGNQFAQSTAVGNKPYTYHKREFIMPHEQTEKYYELLNLMYTDSLPDIKPITINDKNILSNLQIINFEKFESLDKKMSTFISKQTELINEIKSQPKLTKGGGVKVGNTIIYGGK